MSKKIQSWSLYVCVVAGLWSVWLHFASPLDAQWQHFFYIDGHWLVNENEPILKSLLYRLPKIICVIAGFTAAVLLALNHWGRVALSPGRRAGLMTFFITIVLFPALVGLLKDLIRQPCPRDVVEFGGQYAGSLWRYFVEHGENRCFPGAHASAPFSLLGLLYIFDDRARRTLYLLIVLPLAFLIGFYQVAKGAHYVSDTVCTAALAWIFILLTHKTVVKLQN